MTLDQLMSKTGVACIREVSPTTIVIEYTNGSAHPATELERVLWGILRGRLDS
jgi:hypothetical protein